MNEVKLRIIDIKLVHWAVFGSFEEGKEQLKLNINTSINPNFDQRQLEVIVGVNFFHENNPEQDILRADAMTQFGLEIDDSTKGMNIPDQAMITMISIAISHARALITTQAKAFGLQGITIPLLNPTMIFNQIKDKLEMNAKAGKE